MCYPTRENIINIATYIQIYNTQTTSKGTSKQLQMPNENRQPVPMRAVVESTACSNAGRCGIDGQNEVEHAGTGAAAHYTRHRGM